LEVLRSWFVGSRRKEEEKKSGEGVENEIQLHFQRSDQAETEHFAGLTSCLASDVEESSFVLKHALLFFTSYIITMSDSTIDVLLIFFVRSVSS
jgi:hypothetical protein